ncbi:MAG: hypothetical protein JXA18_14480 [Chitinispirillaceae bacterium]|nr:hypothetical protein [Chitinispirillaceae bacterium]
MTNINKATVASALFLFAPLIAHGQIISGSATVTLTGPATREVTAQAEEKALRQLRTELLQWLSENAEISIDTANTVRNLGFNLFLDSCRLAAKTESSFKEKRLTLSYLLTAETIHQKIQSFNAAVDALALQSWNNLNNALKDNNFHAIHSEGITALFYALAHLGPPVAVPQGGRNLADDARRAVQQFYDKMEVKSSGLILSGKTGLAIQNPPVISLRIDSLPFSGITFTGRLQNGAVLFSSATDENGQIVFSDFKIPFVPNGTLLDIGPDAAPVLNTDGFLDPTLFGITLKSGQVQSFIFKIEKSLYSLDYQATSVSNITLPPEFANASHVKKFLEDSCYLQEKAGDGPVDLAIRVKTQVSSYTYDETEEIGIKVTTRIVVNGLLLHPPKTNKNLLVFEKRYGRYHIPPYGLYFWEASGKLREAIKATIAGL